MRLGLVPAIGWRLSAERSAQIATAFMSVAATAASAPLNPAYRSEEFEFYLSDLQAKTLMVEAASISPVIEVARRLGVAILPLVPKPERGVGRFALETAGVSVNVSAAMRTFGPESYRAKARRRGGAPS
jgi:hypothetical protein